MEAVAPAWVRAARSDPPRRVLVIEDDAELSELLQLHLRGAGYEVDASGDGRGGLEEAVRRRRDLVILDLTLPGTLDGLDVCRALRSRGDDVPILMLTARDAEADRIAGFELGADDYVTKPFSLREVIARANAIFRRIDAIAAQARGEKENRLQCGDLCIERAAREVTIAEQRIDLTPREFDLLVQLASHPGTVFTRSQLLDRVWGFAYSGYEHTVNTHINRLRSKIEDDPAHPTRILTVWGVGYKFTDDQGGR